MRTPLGQNFLVDQQIAKNIIKSANLSPLDNVLEIGPGKGILTKYLAQAAGKVLAVEIDKKLADALSVAIARSKATKLSRPMPEKTGMPCCTRNDKVKIIKGDILKINLPQLIEENHFQNYKVVANLPYYITAKTIRLLLETKYPPCVMILMVQKEVGERIVAREGKESLLSISVKFYAEPEILFFVPREKFSPVPEVDSVVIRIKRKEKIPPVETKKFFQIVRAGFSARRKTLANNLASSFRLPKKYIFETLQKSGLETKARAERLRVEDWMKLYSNFEF
jgi:16S rRNA (adenine1518-N6/adenine1519-N6)-dimethyltransferase